MRKILYILTKYYHRVVRSIAFYPVLISLGFLILAIITLYLDNAEPLDSLKERVPRLFITDREIAKTIITTLFTGVLSLTVFSFTMVMVVLSQASSDFSPRLLPGLISNKRHQWILGLYTGTLTFMLIILISLGTRNTESSTLGLSNMIAAILGLLCIATFVYFLHSISVSIQIHSITDSILHKNSRNLKRKVREEKDRNSQKIIPGPVPATLKAELTGYYEGFEPAYLDKSLLNMEYLEILPYPGKEIWPGDIVARTSDELTETQQKSIRKAVRITSNRLNNDRPLSGLTKLTEVAVKALSPGINDPGTAQDAILKLGQLLPLMFQLHPNFLNSINDSKLTIVQHRIDGAALLKRILQPIRFYGRNDYTTLFALKRMLNALLENEDILELYKETLRHELEALLDDIASNTMNKKDINALLSNP